jgi:uncharacterized protein YbdZ (MbtH family)
VSIKNDIRRYFSSWRGVYGEADRGAFLAYTEQNWSDIRPQSLRERLAAGRVSGS